MGWTSGVALESVERKPRAQGLQELSGLTYTIRLQEACL